MINFIFIYFIKKIFKLKTKLLQTYIFGELKNPLLYKKIVMPIIGPIPNIKRINFAEFLSALILDFFLLN